MSNDLNYDTNDQEQRKEDTTENIITVEKLNTVERVKKEAHNKALTLEKAVQKYKDKILYIGAASSYFFIGTQEQYEEEIDEINDTFLKKCVQSQQKAETSKKYHVKQIENLAKRPEKNAKEIMCHGYMLDRALTELERQTNRRSFAEKYHMRKRKVVDYYDLGEDNGFALIIEGEEAGEYWLKSEADKEREGNKRK